MTTLVSAELLKLRTTRAWLGVVLAIIVLCGIAAAATVGSADDAELGTDDLSKDILSTSLISGFLALLLAIIMVTGEWRHGTIARTLLTVPRRHRVLVAKVVAGFVVGVASACLALLVVMLVALPWLGVEGSTFASDADIGERFLRALVAPGLWAMLGIGVGAVIQSQTPALVVALLWLLVVENVLEPLLRLIDADVVVDVLPGRALAAFEGTYDEGLAPWVGGIVGLVWVAGFALLGAARLNSSDIT